MADGLKSVLWLGRWLIAYLDDNSRFIAIAGLFEEAMTENPLLAPSISK